MATVKKSKKKIIIPICIVLVIAIVAGTVFGVVKSNSGIEASLYTIGTDDIYETVSVTGDVSSGAKKEYKVSTVATVKEVFVETGDEVKEGDVLATFDTTSLDSQISSLQSAYDEALSSYNQAVKSQKSASTKADALADEISSLEKQIAKLEKAVSNTTTTTTKKATTTTSTTKKATTTKKTTTKKATTTTAKATTTTKAATTASTTTTAKATTTTTTKAATTRSTTARSTTTTTTTERTGITVNTVALPSSYGTVTGAGTYQLGDEVTLTAYSNSGYEFVCWYTSGGEQVTTNPLTISLNEDVDVTYIAYFKAESTQSASTKSASATSGSVTLNATVLPSSNYGSVSGTGTYSSGDTATLTATANDGYKFVCWYTSDGTQVTNNPTTVSIGDSDISYIALFSSDDTSSSSSSSSSSVSVTDTIKEISDALTELNTTFTKITDDVDTIATLTEVAATAISEAIESGNYDSDYIAEAVSTAVSEAILSGMIDSAKLLVESDTASTMISSAVSSIDFAAIANAVTESNNVALTSSQIQLAALYAQYEIYALEADDTVLTAQEDAVDAAKTALDALKEEQEELENGWKASFDGTITSVDIVSGGQTTALSTAITLENLNQLVATISLGEYDVHKVKVGMPAVITTAYGTYDGEVATIAPVATGGSESSLLDSVGSMAGISGLSSLTESGAGVECTVTISGADENIIPGFDADVEISTGEYLGVTVVPIESITLEKTGSYVYLYDEEEGTVTKTLIETGATSDSAYEVTSGLQVGDKVIAAPQSDYEEDTFEIKVVE